MNRFSIKLLVVIFAIIMNYQAIIASKEKTPSVPNTSKKQAKATPSQTKNQTASPSSVKPASMAIITRETKNDLPANLLAEAQEKKMSILKPTAEQLPILYQKYPDGSLLFPKNPEIASQFNTMINAIKKNSDLIEFFRKIHITSLNQLYSYLMKIYTNFNLINPGFVQSSETPTADEGAYLFDEATYATNKKKLIMNHFINIIQAQFGASIVSYSPATPPDMAVTLGKMFVHNDYGIDLTPFATQQTDGKIVATQQPFIDFLQQYIKFFQTYTNCLSQADPITGVNQYFIIAQSIKKMLEPNQIPTQTLSMNPNMFFYDVESMRSIQFIPFIAGTIPKNSPLIPWASIVVNAAVKNSSTNGHAVAFFTDAMDKKTATQNRAQHLYMLVETGPSLFQQELLAQPAWLNTQDGCIRILRACLGDFSALVGMGILDNETEFIIQKALPKQ